MATATQGREVTVKHGVFWYHEPGTHVTASGKEEPILLQRLAFHGETVTLTRDDDIERGDLYGAFFSPDELKALGRSPNAAAVEEDAESPDLNDLDDQELVDYLMSTGEFDGKKKPTIDDVVVAVDDDPELAERILVADDTANGGVRRTGLEEKLQPVIDGE